MARTDTRKRVGVIGSSKYENKLKIKELLFRLKNEFTNDLVIVSGGRSDGADKHVKKFALMFNCEYKEFNPAHTQHNLYSVLSENYYGKPFSPRYYFHRNSLMLKYVDYLFIFLNDADNKNSDILSVITEAEKKNIKYIIIN